MGSRIEAFVRPRLHRLPEIGDGVAGAALDIDQAGVALGAIADEAAGAKAGQIDADRDAFADVGIVGIDQPLARMQARASASASSSAWPRRKRICDSREPSRTSTGKVRGEISA